MIQSDEVLRVTDETSRNDGTIRVIQAVSRISNEVPFFSHQLQSMGFPSRSHEI